MTDQIPTRVQLALNVEDIDEAVAFYSALFRTEPAKRRPGYANFAVVEPPLKLVLLDLRLPRVDGLEVLRRMRADARTCRLPVVVLTSSQEESDLVRAYDLGANSYLVKPVESEAFMKSVAELGLYWMLLNKVPGETR